jgi:hypothetical protein
MLMAALANAEQTAVVKSSEYGVKRVIQMTIIGPNGKEGMIEVVWQMDNGSNVWRLITAIRHPFK